MSDNDPILVVFAKKPVPGKVKTRLCPPLSGLQAAEVAILLIRKSLENFCAHWPGKIELCVWPDARDDLLAGLSSEYGVSLSTQASGDLGEKMRLAMAEKVNLGHKVAIMGADVPHCGADILQAACVALKSDKNVIGPTADGGYYCIGINQPKLTMFNKVHWGSEEAYTQTLSSCADVGINFECILPVLNDLDTFEDLQQIAVQLPGLRQFIND